MDDRDEPDHLIDKLPKILHYFFQIISTVCYPKTNYYINMKENISTNSASSIENQRELRINKLNILRSRGITVFPATSERSLTLKELKDDFNNLENKFSEESEGNLTLAGRIKRKRISGKIGFTTLEDESLPGGFQLVFRFDLLNSLDERILNFKDFKDLVDEGDYIEAKGYLKKSSSNEPSLFIREYRLLTKSLRPLPDMLSYSNLEARYLDRVVDFKMDTKDDNGLSVRDILRKKAKYWSIWREEMDKEGFLSIENPALEHIPGGAETKPFTTFYNDLDKDMFLRISLELPLKKLIAGGFESVYEIGRVFRNESSSPQHLQDFTFIEWYKAYTDFNWAASFVKTVYQRMILEILGDFKQKDYYGNLINWGEWCDSEEASKNGWSLVGGWPKIKYFDAVRYFSNGKIDTEGKTDLELLQMCHDNGIKEVKLEDGIGTLLDKLWKKARLNTVNPFFLILPPVDLEPLAKRSNEDNNLTERWQIVAGRAELGKAFSELNDPIDQFNRFSEQQKARDGGNEEAQFMDLEYIKAMEYGMPPMSGFGTSERFLSFILGKHIRECSSFPYTKQDKANDNKFI